eukprot:g4718.t1
MSPPVVYYVSTVAANGDIIEGTKDFGKRPESFLRTTKAEGRQRAPLKSGQDNGKSEAREMKWYCPGPSDYSHTTTTAIVDNNGPDWGAGWVHDGSSGGATWLNGVTWTLNFVGGGIYVDGIDYSGVEDGENGNIYLTSPHNMTWREKACDANGFGGSRCYGMTLMEGAGNKGYCPSWHFEPEGGAGPSQSGRAKTGIFGLKYEVDANGCSKLYEINNVDPKNPTSIDSFSTTQAQSVDVSPPADNCSISKAVYESRGGLLKSGLC